MTAAVDEQAPRWMDRAYDRFMAWQARRAKSPEQDAYNELVVQVRESEVWTAAYSGNVGGAFTAWSVGQVHRVPDDWPVEWARGRLMIGEWSAEPNLIPWRRGESRSLSRGDTAPVVETGHLDAPPAVALARVPLGAVVEVAWVDLTPAAWFMVRGAFHGIRRRGLGKGGADICGEHIPAEATVTGHRVLP